MTQRKNPIQRRLDRVSDQWVEFAELPDARLLCWRLRPDEYPMIDAFLRLESDEGGSLPDVFVTLQSPFGLESPYGFALCGELVKQAEEMQAAVAPSPKGPWVPPAWQREHDVTLFVRTCDSFLRHFELPGRLAVLFAPSELGDLGAFQTWLQRFGHEAPPNLRGIVLEGVKAPALEPLVRAEPIRVVAVPADLDMPSAKLEVSKEAGGLETPGGKFRHLMVQLSNALGEQNLDQGQLFGDAALAIAAAQGWFALAVPVHFALGAALAGAGRVQEANERYLKAELASTEGEKAGDPNSTKLKAQSRMVRGGLLVHMRAYGLAAKLFTETLPMAAAAGDPRMVLDCYRLASFCHEQDGKYELAWKSGVDGLGYARDLDRETLDTSTFPYLGEGLMRLTQRPEYSASSLRIEREIVSVAGRRDWRPGAAGAAAPKPAGAPA